jgi:DASH complex subunit SPC19
VEHLLRRVEQHLAKMERREKALIAKSELQEGRLHQKPSLFSSRRGMRSGSWSVGGNVADAEKLRILKSKKERLAHAVERLSLQAGHKVCDVSKSRCNETGY